MDMRLDKCSYMLCLGIFKKISVELKIPRCVTFNLPSWVSITEKIICNLASILLDSPFHRSLLRDRISQIDTEHPFNLLFIGAREWYKVEFRTEFTSISISFSSELL